MNIYIDALYVNLGLGLLCKHEYIDKMGSRVQFYTNGRKRVNTFQAWIGFKGGIIVTQ